MAGLFSTHPPMEERIARLQAMAGDTRAAPSTHPQATSMRHGGSVPQSSRGPWG
jgi:heat shock protein HtpX